MAKVLHLAKKQETALAFVLTNEFLSVHQPFHFAH